MYYQTEECNMTEKTYLIKDGKIKGILGDAEDYYDRVGKYLKDKRGD